MSYACKAYWQPLLREGIYVYSPESLEQEAGFKEFWKSSGEPSRWKATMLWNEAHPSEYIQTRHTWVNANELYVSLIILMARLHRDGLLEEAVLRHLVPELLNGLMDYLKVTPRLRLIYRSSILQAGHGDRCSFFDACAYLKPNFPAVQGEHRKVEIQGALAACKDEVYDRILLNLHKVSGVELVRVMKSV
jgi:hypothetical protein